MLAPAIHASSQTLSRRPVQRLQKRKTIIPMVRQRRRKRNMTPLPRCIMATALGGTWSSRSSSCVSRLAVPGPIICCGTSCQTSLPSAVLDAGFGLRWVEAPGQSLPWPTDQDQPPGSHWPLSEKRHASAVPQHHLSAWYVILRVILHNMWTCLPLRAHTQTV